MKYKLKLHETGDYIYVDECVPAFVAPDINAAWDIITERHDEHAEWLDWAQQDGDKWIHPMVAIGRVVYKRDIDNEDFLPEYVEPGDTVYDIVNNVWRPLNQNEIRIWLPGLPSPHWSITPPRYCNTHLNGYRITCGGDTAVEGIQDRAKVLKVRDALCAQWQEKWKTAHPNYKNFIRALV